ncbi:MAG TPA: hypothetical protein P5044_05420, partial [bacterium]|nr:hypothetical protein [bacterium]
MFWSCTSCNSSNPKTDDDNLTDNDTKNDVDLIKPDIDLNDDAVDIDVAVDEETDDDIELADIDYQGAEDCPDLTRARFPYYNDDKSIHFCRKCDKPTVKDPQCVENLWKDAAAALYAVSPESECKDGYPCDMP